MRSLRWKLIFSFIFTTFFITAITGVCCVARASFSYHSSFYNDVTSVFNSKLVWELNDGENAAVESVSNAILNVSNRLGINRGREYCIISAETGNVLSGSEQIDKNVYQNSDNYSKALTGIVGDEYEFYTPVMDYAVPVETTSGRVIVYIRNVDAQLIEMFRNTLVTTGQIMLIGVVVSGFIGYLLSRTIIKPISNLTIRAKHMSEGAFDVPVENVKDNNEIGRLTATFNNMSVAFKGTLSDISTEKNKIEAILQNMTDGVMSFGTDGKIVHINSTARKMLNIENIEKYRFDKLFSMLGADILIGDLLYLEERRSCEREVTKGNTALKLNFAVFDDERNKTGGVLVVFHDITRQQKLELSRREFVANVSHELRTPLTTVKSYAETLLDIVKDNKTAASFTNTILNETDRMTRLVKDFLVLSSLEDSSSLKKTYFSMGAMINDVVSTMSLVAKEKGHRLEFKRMSEIPQFYGDCDKLEQVLYNIISNSIKYTPNGGKITVKAGKVYHEVHITVQDTGIGIPEKDLARIFERFYRVDKARSRELGGTGLGLAISKSIIDSHGGQIHIDSKQGEGTTVIISLPIKQS